MDVVMLVAWCDRRAEREPKKLGKEVKAFSSLKQFAEAMDRAIALVRRSDA